MGSHTHTHTAGVHIISAQKTGTHFPSDTFSISPACLSACLHVCLPHIKGQSTLWNKCLIGSGSAPLTLDLAGTQTPHSRGEFPLRVFCHKDVRILCCQPPLKKRKYTRINTDRKKENQTEVKSKISNYFSHSL